MRYVTRCHDLAVCAYVATAFGACTCWDASHLGEYSACGHEHKIGGNCELHTPCTVSYTDGRMQPYSQDFFSALDCRLCAMLPLPTCVTHAQAFA